jgi:hypothetical protein
MADAGGRQPKTETLVETLAKSYDGKLQLKRSNGAPKILVRAHLQGKSMIRTTGEQDPSAATRCDRLVRRAPRP